MSKPRSRARRVVDAVFAGLTWVAAAGLILWFYDWINRWYVVVGAVVVLALAAMAVEKLARQHRITPSDQLPSELPAGPLPTGVVPLPREPLADAETWVAAEEQIA
jgi:hypothetical protein